MVYAEYSASSCCRAYAKLTIPNTVCSNLFDFSNLRVGPLTLLPLAGLRDSRELCQAYHLRGIVVRSSQWRGIGRW